MPPKALGQLERFATTTMLDICPDARLALVRRHGTFTLAYSTAVQPRLSHFRWGDGYIAYAQRGKLTYALGDPVAPTQQYAELIGQFLSQYSRPTFVQVSTAAAEILQQQGYYINEMGVDTALDLTEYNFQGKAREWLRYSFNWIVRRDYRIEDATFASLAADEVQALSEQWRETRTVKRREVWFLNRPIVFADEPDVRKFFLFDAQGQIVAFVFFDPIYSDGEVIGYCTSIKRRRPGTSPYAEPAIMKVAIEHFQLEGKRILYLGLSPLAGITNRRFRSNPFLHFSFRYGFRAWWVNRFFYNLVGHAQFKRRFGGQELPTYYASPVLFNDVRVWGLLKLSGIL